MGPGSADERHAADERPFEESLRALESIVGRLESGALGLEEALAAFEEGVKLARRCEAQLDTAERRVELLLRGPDGSLRSEPFEVPAAQPGAAPAPRGDDE